MSNAATSPSPCRACTERPALPFEFSMAFQPIVDVRNRSLFACEALVRGTDGSGAAAILAQVTDENRYQFDQACRVKAIELAARLQLTCYVSINFLPNAVYEPAACIRATLEAAKQHNFPLDRLLFEVTEGEKVTDHDHLKSILGEYTRGGSKPPSMTLARATQGHHQLDMALLRGIDSDPVRQAIVRGILGVCQALNIEVIAEGVETVAELTFLRGIGVYLFQGYLLARPAYEQIPTLTGRRCRHER
ncbi:EAL domain-containing protein [Halopseudomonas pachastrellae]|nr:EAL domain-containing protein [Halopseudomonas pachastrellae]